MNSIKWFFMSPSKKLEYTFKVLYKNKQRLHFAGFIFDFVDMKIEVEDHE